MKLKLHHIGCAVNNIEYAKKYYCEIFGFKYEKGYISEEMNLRAAFLYKEENDVYIELLQKLDYNNKSSIDKILEDRMGGVYHACFLVNDMKQALEELSKKEFIVLNRKNIETQDFIARFLITPDNYIIEILQKKIHYN